MPFQGDLGLPIGLCGIAQPTAERLPIDRAGAVTITGASIGVLLGLTWVGEGDAWTSTRVLVALVAGVAFLAAFVVAERRAADPILPGRLFTDRSVLGVLIVITALGFALFAAVLYAPLFVQGVLGAGATGAGTILLPMVVTMTVMGVVVGRLMARTNRIKVFLVVGTAVVTAALLLLSTLGAGSTQVQVGPYLFAAAARDALAGGLSTAFLVAAAAGVVALAGALLVRDVPLTQPDSSPADGERPDPEGPREPSLTR